MKCCFYSHVSLIIISLLLMCETVDQNVILQLYSSMDFGKKWQLVHENVMPGRFYWYDFPFCPVIDH